MQQNQQLKGLSMKHQFKGMMMVDHQTVYFQGNKMILTPPQVPNLIHPHSNEEERMDNEDGLVQRLPSNMGIRRTRQRVASCKSPFVLECATKYTLNQDDITIVDYVFDDTRIQEIQCENGYCLTSIFTTFIVFLQTLHFVPLVHVFKFTSNAPQQFLGGPLLLTLLIFFEPPRRLWLKDLSIPIVILGGLNLDLSFFLPFQDSFQVHFQVYLGPSRDTQPTQVHLDPLKFTQAHLGTSRPTLVHQVHLGILTHLCYLLGNSHMTCIICIFNACMYLISYSFIYLFILFIYYHLVSYFFYFFILQNIA